MAAREVEAPVEEGQVGRDDDRGRGHRPPAIRLDAAGRARVDADREGPLEQQAAGLLERPREAMEVLHGMELGLVGEADGGRDGKGQVGVLDNGRWQAGSQRRTRLGLDPVALVRLLRVGEVRLAAQVAVDPVHGGQLERACDAAFVRLSVRAPRIFAELPFQPVVGEPMEGAQLRRRESGRPRPHEAPLDHDHPRAPASELERRTQSRDAGADHADVRVQIGLERRALRALGAVEPERGNVGHGPPLSRSAIGANPARE